MHKVNLHYETETQEWVTLCPDYPHVSFFADTPEEALAGMKDILDTAREMGVAPTRQDILDECTRSKILEGLAKLNGKPNDMFRRMYGHHLPGSTSMSKVVEGIPAEKLSHALMQVVNTLKKPKCLK